MQAPRHSEHESPWTDAAGPEYPPLEGDHATDIAIIGAGITGISAAHLLRRLGYRVTVLEARRVGRQVTGLSSAKVTSQHNLIYARLSSSFGADAARTYAEVNEAALRHIGSSAHELHLDCQFVPRAAYTYTQEPDRVAELREEAAVAVGLGLPARFTTDTPLPYSVAGAVVFDNQAQFDPYAYVRGLAERIVTSGVEIFEDTRVTGVDEGTSYCTVVTDRGVVTASHVIVATNLPIVDDGQYFAHTYPIAHCAIALSIDGAGPEGMFISVDEPTRSLRTLEAPDGTRLLVVGPRFTPGQAVDTQAEFAVLEAFARAHFPVRSLDYRWTNEDYQSVDGLPYVGRLSSEHQRVFVATGFGGWGITTGVAAAAVLADHVAGVTTSATRLFDSTRSTPRQSARELIGAGLGVAKTWLQDQVSSAPRLDLDALNPGEGRVVQLGDKKVAVSRDPQGTLHAVSAECSHLGCVLGWNSGMATWDCPCHGSIFTADGVVVHGPAVKDLEQVPLTGQAGAKAS
jgi:glycine/D-amino acid oxidase-like deaminating enzyme/nitrite reductase/ring-hydroxylating ferredoxin subunit